MGCICSKGSNADDYVAENEVEKEKELNKSPVKMVAPLCREKVIGGVVDKPRTEGSLHSRSKMTSESNESSYKPGNVEENGKTRIIERPKNGHQRFSTPDMGDCGTQQTTSRIVSMPHGAKAEQVSAGWPSWLVSVAGEGIRGWVPRSAESYEKLNKIGQGTYSSVYKARDLTNDKIVAMKKVRFVKMDPESVRFMAREILILRKLDHPNIMKLESIVTSRISGSLYLVFEYMDHDLAGLLASPKVKFTEPQASNLLVDNNGILKIGDFGLANFFKPDQKQPLTSRVVTLWYRAPELLLGATEYGVAIDMWSAGCILAELFAGKPIMPGRTEVEQMHKIFKLCGSPSEKYWKKSKLPHATSFKPQHPYRRCVADMFKDFPSSALALVDVLLSVEPEDRGTASSALKSEFFTTKPLPCDPSSLPKYSPSKEYDAKLREEEARRRKTECVKGGGAESIRNNSRQSKAQPEGQGQSNKSTSVKYNLQEDSGSGFPIEPPRGNLRNGYSHSNSMIHPNAVGCSQNKRVKDDSSHMFPERTCSSQHVGELTRQGSQMRPSIVDSFHHSRGADGKSNNDSLSYVPKRSRILCSGPLMPPGGNMEDMLKEHERQIQEAVRKARLDKAMTKKNCYE
ncbi:unnamed protein product [Fraxinus pennsylvanica]|uniref:Protein kinase domain-containing protein n=1 Tax=Fraxinus pennsylvanica TaxID=56036 RepID=A0AAD2DU71_9LAMI|nr:unnamed protein product [Fraxinus pennsylvanica]